ncbi:MAG: ATPase, V0 complex, subunit E1/e2 [Piptocephalis tieghemiana]|nr:MAG: ATPase, V0 complex, subunit E1/e2 [Piptocephalis tieghemiana]
MSLFPVFLLGLICLGLCLLAYMFSPKGRDQTLWRSSLILTFICLYSMWAVTYMAQMNPLIAPRRSDLRPEHFAGGHH